LEKNRIIIKKFKEKNNAPLPIKDIDEVVLLSVFIVIEFRG